MGKGVPKKLTSQQPDTYYYVRISPQGKVVEKVPFQTKSTDWKIVGAHEKDGIVTLYGPAVGLGKPDDALTRMGIRPQIKEKGFDNFQLVAIANGKTKYVSAPSTKEMEKGDRAS